MESLNIVRKLEQMYPNPSLHLDTGVHEDIQKATAGVIGPLRTVILPAAPRNILREPSASWFSEDREQRFGKSLDQLEVEQGGEKAWKAAESGLETLKTELTAHKRDEGPFVLGKDVSYGDFLIAGLFDWFQKADTGLYERLVSRRSSKRAESC
jgi:glutathione S-transferase